MNICIPITRDNGIQSPVSLHFGSAPIFMVVDTESGDCRAITNRNLHHDHGMCQPLAQLAGERLDAMVVGGIGMGAFGKLKAANGRYPRLLFGARDGRGDGGRFQDGTLREVTPATACAHHGNGPHGHGTHDHA